METMADMGTGYIAPIKIGVSGANGRMGCAIQQEIKKHIEYGKNIKLAYISPPTEGTYENWLCNSDVIIDFSGPENTMQILLNMIELRNRGFEKFNCNGTHLVIGTTGFSDIQMNKIKEYAKVMPILFSANMSSGANQLAKQLESVAKDFQHGWDVEIIEEHHNQKVDAPSGTAKLLGEVIAKAWGKNLDDIAVYGDRNVKRQTGQIGFASVRCGGVIGDHRVIFDNGYERIEFRHYAYTRDIFAQGAVRKAIEFAKGGYPAGKLYAFNDVNILQTKME